MTKDKNCGNCNFWNAQLEDSKGQEAYGECRRYPPTDKQSGSIFVGYKDHIMEVSKWEIITNKDCWCGEWK